MRCFTSYQRFNADTINGETLVVTSRYTTFDKQEMDFYEENIIRKTIGSGLITEFEMPKESSDADRTKGGEK